MVESKASAWQQKAVPHSAQHSLPGLHPGKYSGPRAGAEQEWGSRGLACSWWSARAAGPSLAAVEQPGAGAEGRGRQSRRSQSLKSTARNARSVQTLVKPVCPGSRDSAGVFKTPKPYNMQNALERPGDWPVRLQREARAIRAIYVIL